MIPTADENVTGRARSRHLRVAAKAQIRIRLDEHFRVDGTVWIVTGRAAFAHGRVFKNKRSRLFAMALRARFVQPRHGESARRFHDVRAVRIVALNAIHFSLQHRMMLRKMKFSLHFRMTFDARLRILAGIDDEFFQAAASAHRDVFAARTVAGFATELAGRPAVFQMQARVRAGGKNAGDFFVTVRAGFVADECRAFDLQWRDHGAIRRGTGIQKHRPRAGDQRQSGQPVKSRCFF